jgi:hypothetical protein
MNARLALALAPLAVGLSLVGGAAGAGSSRAINVREEGRLHFVRESGSQILDEGPATGTVPGTVRLRFAYNGSPSVSARFTIYAREGTLSGEAKGRLNSPTSPYPSFRGSLRLTGGTGRWAHARGGGELFGVYDRRTYGLVVQALGRLQY